MRQKGEFLWAKLKKLNGAMVELPYKGDRMVMQIILPDEINGLSAMEDRLKTLPDLQELFRKKQRKARVDVELPKFRLEHEIDLKNHTRALGMTDMFGDNADFPADFSGIDGTKSLYVSEVVQKAFIEVNEEGSEAAAATV